jgi:hypothetical protein
MTVFAVIALGVNPRLEAAVKAKFPEGDYYRIAPDQFMVYSPTLTTQQVSEALGAPGGGVGRVMILRVTTYVGWHNKDLWEWIETRMAPKPPFSTPSPETPDE